ncbi:MAG: class I SAM-dependent RNA methyltransferase [Rhizomicrobium sp.]
MTLCRHFGACGGCRLQHLEPDAYRSHKRDRVFAALAGAGLENAKIADLLAVPEKSRRRAVLKFGKEAGQTVAGFHAPASHRIVDMHECLVLKTSLLNLASCLRTALARLLAEGEKAEVHVTETDAGLDMAFRWRRAFTPVLARTIAEAFPGAARIVFNGEMLALRATPVVRLGEIAIIPPPHAFLQATREGEDTLRARVLALTQGATRIVDLFAGLGTLTLALARQAKVHAVEEDGQALGALVQAARNASGLKPITTERRDLFKRPLSAPELEAFDAVVLDPPRAGALAQIKKLASSKTRRIAYVSCDAASFARDAGILVEAGFQMGEVTPVDQFLYSDHIELVAGFARQIGSPFHRIGDPI